MVLFYLLIIFFFSASSSFSTSASSASSSSSSLDLVLDLSSSLSYKIVERGANRTIIQSTKQAAQVFSSLSNSWLSIDNGKLTIVDSKTEKHVLMPAVDDNGEFVRSRVSFSNSGDDTILFTLTFDVFKNSSTILFTITFENGLENAATGDPLSVSTSFPDLEVPDEIIQNKYLNFLSYRGSFFWANTLGVYSSPSQLNGGYDGGPIVFFDSSSSLTLIISPASQFMTTSFYTNTQIQCGVGGNVSSIPAGFEYSFVVHGGNMGINQAFDGWGKFLRTRFDKNRDRALNDYTVNYLNYYTDNGAYYYYHPIPDKTYEDTLLTVYQESLKQKIPYRVLQLDSWWYFKGISNGLKNWTANPVVFPHGLEYLHQSTQWPIVAHNRYWSSNTDYWTANGGGYNFLADSSGAPIVVPDDDNFWLDLFNNATKWGLTVYEQDWLYNEYEGITQMTSDVSTARTWLMRMGDAASTTGINIQYCMPYARHALQSLEIAAVTQIRSSDDYEPNDGRPQWRMGESSLFTWAVGSVPFKDTFWTTQDQPGNSYNQSGVHPTLSLYISVLSLGPVAPGDSVSFANRSLIMRACDESGRILKADRPATSIDQNIVQKATNDHTMGPTGHVFITWTSMGSFRWLILLSVDVLSDYSLSLSSLSVNFAYDSGSLSDVAYLALTIVPSVDSVVSFGVVNSSLSSSLLIPVSSPNVALFHMSYLSPLLSPVFTLIGELSKVVPVSRNRISHLDFDVNQLTLTLHLTGHAHEIITMTTATISSTSLWQRHSSSCTLSSSGLIIMIIAPNRDLDDVTTRCVA